MAFEVHVEATPSALQGLRARLAAWLDANGVRGEDADGILLAAHEAAANAIEHAADATLDTISVAATRTNGDVTVTVTDSGRWDPDPGDPDRGRGFQIMQALAEVHVRSTPHGTVVRLRRPIRAPAG